MNIIHQYGLVELHSAFFGPFVIVFTVPGIRFRALIKYENAIIFSSCRLVVFRHHVRFHGFHHAKLMQDVFKGINCALRNGIGQLFS